MVDFHQVLSLMTMVQLRFKFNPTEEHQAVSRFQWLGF
jgi:hypothetical protein